MTERDICLNCTLDDCDDANPLCPLKVRSAEGKRRYYEENRAKIAEGQRRYYEENRAKWNAYMRDYLKRRREQKRERTVRENQGHL